MSTAPPASSFVLPHDADHEVVERKGLGHPDTVADGIAELTSIRYSEYCLREFGAVLHHNLDKVAVLGGRVAFGPTSGHYVRPLRIVFGGRASRADGIPTHDVTASDSSGSFKGDLYLVGAHGSIAVIRNRMILFCSATTAYVINP